MKNKVLCLIFLIISSVFSEVGLSQKDEIAKQKRIYKTLKMISFYQKKNLRELTKAELMDLEDIKFKVLCNLKPYEEITQEKVASIMEKNPRLTTSQKRLKEQLKAEFIDNNDRMPTIDELRQIYNLVYSFDFAEEK